MWSCVVAVLGTTLLFGATVVYRGETWGDALRQRLRDDIAGTEGPGLRRGLRDNITTVFLLKRTWCG